MSRQLLTVSAERETLKQLVACDQSGLHSLSVPIQPNQGLFKFGGFIASDGARAAIASQALGVLPVTLDTDELSEELSGRITIFTHGRFLWTRIKAANQTSFSTRFRLTPSKARESLSTSLRPG